jgi:hypothetical protein
MLLSWLYFGAFGEVYGVSSNSNIKKKLISYHSLEKELLLGVVLLIIGIVIGLNVIYNWSTGGFGDLYQVQSTVIAMILSMLGIQTIFSGMFLSLLLLNQYNENG